MTKMTTVFMCRALRSQTPNRAVFTADYFKSARISLFSEPGENFETKEAALNYIQGRGMLAVYEVSMPYLHLNSINKTTQKVEINRAFLGTTLTPAHIKGLYSFITDKNIIVKNPSFDETKITELMQKEITAGLETKRKDFPAIICDAEPQNAASYLKK